MIPIFSNSLGKEELEAVEKVFKSKWVGSGDRTLEFENQFGGRLNSKYSLSFNCATAILYGSMKILGIKPGDEVLLPTINFIGCANAIIDYGAKPVFCDVDLNTFNVTPEEIERRKTDKTKALLMLHYGGNPAKFDEIKEACGDIKIIEDSCNTLFSKYKDRYCGTLGDIGCFSFDSMKILVTGDGGMMTFQNDEYYEKALQYRYLGLLSRKKSGTDSLNKNNENWWEIELGSTSGRFVSNDIVSSIALEQMKKVDGFISRRKEIWDTYKSELKDLDWLVLPPEPEEGCTTSYFLFWLRIKNGWRDEFARYMVDNGVYVTFRYYPLHKIELYKEFSLPLKNADEICESTINLPVHQNLTDDNVEHIINTIKNFRRNK
jgi:dTDP-4-amino-4,6-dideoxygalactose transaminase